MRRALALFPLLAACGGNAGDLVITPDNNYTFDGVLEVAEVDVQSQTDFMLDWSGMTTDLRGRPFDGGVDEVLLVEFRLTKEEILDKAVRNDLFQADAETQWLYSPAAGDTSAMASQFEIVGNLVDPETDLVEDPNVNWLASLSDKPDGRFDLLMSRFVNLQDDATNTTVSFEDGDTVLTADVDMHSMPPVVTEEGVGPYFLDWSQIQTDANGNEFDPLLGDELLIAHYDFSKVEEVEDAFLQLDEQASELYRMSVYGETKIAKDDYPDGLGEAKTADGKAFEGFTKDGIWLVGITCTTCISPVPLVISVVEVE